MMPAAAASASGLVSKEVARQSGSHVVAGTRKTLAASMFNSPNVSSAYRRSAVVVLSDAADTQPRATTVHSFDLAFGASPAGSFGIGITLEKVGHGPNTGLPIIKEVLPNGSAFAKLACGDVLISVNGQSLDKNALLKATMQAIKGAGDTFVDVTILRFHPVRFNDETLTFRLKRQPLQHLSPFKKRTPTLPTTFTTSPHSSFIGVNLLTPRIDYPPEPSLHRPLPEQLKQQQMREHNQHLAASQSSRHLHQPPAAPEASSPVTTAPQTQQQAMSQLQYNQALLEMNRIDLLPHQHQELLRLQLQLNHLQQLSLKQQMKTEQLQQEAKLLSPRSVVKNVAKFPPAQPQPWPLPPPRVVSTEPDAATAFSPRSTVASDNPPDNSTIQETAMSLAKVEDVPALEADQSSTLSASFEATDSGSNLPSSYQHSKAFNERESESNVHPSVINATDAPRCQASERTEIVPASPHPRGPVDRLLPPHYSSPDASANDLVESHSHPPEPAHSGSRLVSRSLSSSGEQTAETTTIGPLGGYVTPKPLGGAKGNLNARLGFASGATPAVASWTSEQELRAALAATQAELADARRSLRFCMTELFRARSTGPLHSGSNVSAVPASDDVYVEHGRLDPQWEINVGFTPAQKSVVAPHSPHMFQAIIGDEKSFEPRTPIHHLNTNAANEFQGSKTSEHLKLSGSTSTEMQLLNGEIAHLRQRLQMEVLANQELEEMIESTLELLLHFGPTKMDALDTSSASQAYESVKRTLEDRLFARQQRILALYKTQLV